MKRMIMAFICCFSAMVSAQTIPSQQAEILLGRTYSDLPQVFSDALTKVEVSDLLSQSPLVAQNLNVLVAFTKTEEAKVLTAQISQLNGDDNIYFLYAINSNVLTVASSSRAKDSFYAVPANIVYAMPLAVMELKKFELDPSLNQILLNMQAKNLLTEALETSLREFKKRENLNSLKNELMN